MVRDFQAIIGREARAQMLERAGRLPRSVVACVGGGSNAMGIFHAFVPDADVELVGVEAAGHGLDSGQHSASLTRAYARRAARRPQLPAAGRAWAGASGALHLGGPRLSGVGPEHSFLRDSGRATYVSITDDEALQGFALLGRLEGIIPALETAHAVAWIAAQRGRWGAEEPVLLCVSGRGDKDVAQVSAMRILGA